MENDELKILDEEKDAVEVMDIAIALIKLEIQIQIKNREGMIAALKNAQRIAKNEIVKAIDQNGYAYSKPWDCISNDELYYMLFQYEDGLRTKGIDKVGEKAFKEICEECTKSKQLQ